jgi:hypothetical protein
LWEANGRLRLSDAEGVRQGIFGVDFFDEGGAAIEDRALI